LKTDSYKTLINFISRTLLKKEQVILVIILILNFVLRLYGVIVDVDYFFREATFGMAAWRIIDGDLPYRDFFHSQAPLSPFLLAFVFLLFGVGILQARLFLVFFTTFTCFMIFMAGKRINYKTGLLGSLIFAIIPLSVKFGMHAVNDLIAMTFCLIGYYFLTSAIMVSKNKRNLTAERKYSILAGLFVSVGVMIKVIVAPIVLAFIIILAIEGYLSEFEIKSQMKNIFFLIVGFVVPFLVVFSPFFLLYGDKLTTQILGQHLAKRVFPYGRRLDRMITRVILVNPYFFVLFCLSALFAARQPYGRGLIICLICMISGVFFLVPAQNPNYYEINVIWMSMGCGFFPLSDFKSLNLRSALLSAIVFLGLIILNFTFFIQFYPSHSYFSVISSPLYNYLSNYWIQIFFASFIIALILFIVHLIRAGQFNGFVIKNSVKRIISSPSQILKDLRAVLNHDGVKIGLVLFFIILIAVTDVTYYPRLSAKDKNAIDWVKANTSPDDYILADNLKINLRAKRRSPFAEISDHRTRVGELTGEMFIEACYEYNIRVVVKTRELFDRYETYDIFLEFLEANYVPIKEGHIIYVRTSSLE
jgi:hypothetical protein